MKQLFWKEFYELRLLPVFTCLIVFLLTVADYISARSASSPMTVSIRDTENFLYYAWAFTALVAGAGLFSQEIGNGTLQFISALPINRSLVWWIKFGTSLSMLLLSIFLSVIAWIVTLRIILGPQFEQKITHWASTSYSEPISGIVLILIGFFATSLAVSNFCDRFSSAAMASLLFACFGWVVITMISNDYQIVPYHYQQLAMKVLLVLGSFSCFSISYWTFTRGESLRSSKRMAVGAMTGGLSLFASIVFFWIGAVMKWW